MTCDECGKPVDELFVPQRARMNKDGTVQDAYDYNVCRDCHDRQYAERFGCAPPRATATE